MKKTKSILAILLAVLLLAVSVPFAASAATSTGTIKLTCADEGFTFTMYQLGTIDITTGAFTADSATDSSITDIINGEYTSSKSQNIIDACDAATNIGTSVGTYDSTTDGTSKTFSSMTTGVYYVKCTDYPATVKAVGNSLVTLPEYENGEWKTPYEVTSDVGSKVATGDVDIDKVIVDGDNKDYTVEGLGNTVKFEITTNPVGSTATPASSYVITDTMSEGLTYNDDLKVYLESSSGTEVDSANYTVATSGTTTITITFDTDYLKTSEFCDATNIVVAYSATVNKNAVIGNPGNPNTVYLEYQGYGSSITSKVDGPTVVVFTVAVQVVKTDASSGATLSGAEFVIADNNGTVLGTATTDSSGIGTFKDDDGNEIQFDDDAGYTIIETKAPDGYVLPSSSVSVTVSKATVSSTTADYGYALASSSALTDVSITNSAVTAPQTGGMGTMIFTIGGAALIACAGIMLVVVLKKRKSAN